MENILNKDIRAVIDQCPEVGRILEEYGIGCAPCSVGSCLVSDVVGIHGLDPQTEATLMYKIEKAIYPDRDIQEPKVDLSKVAPKVYGDKLDLSSLGKKIEGNTIIVKDFSDESTTDDK